MDLMTTFERRLADELDQMAGPGRRIDAMAMTRTVATQHPRWRLRSLSSATRIVLAGAAAAALGVFLVIAGTPPQPDRQVTPVAASPSPSAAASIDGLVTEQVEPGVLRIIRDDAGHDLDARHPDFRYDLDTLTIADDGTIWIRSSPHHTDNQANDAGVPLWAVGRDDIQVPQAELGDPVPMADGSILFIGDSVIRFDGTTFGLDFGASVRPARAGTLWLVEPTDLMNLADDPSVIQRPAVRLAAIWTERGWVDPWDLGRVAVSGDHECEATALGVACLGSEGSLEFLVGTPINQIATAPDGSIWAVGGLDGEGGGLYRISLP